MQWQPIHRSLSELAVQPNLIDYERTYADFTWETHRQAIDGLPAGQGLNLAYEAVDRHAAGPRRDKVALRCLGKSSQVRDFTYGELSEQSNRFANVLRRLDIGKGDRVFVLAGRIPELFIAVLGTWKNGSVLCPLFSAFGPEPIQQRLSLGDGRILVTTMRLYQQRGIVDMWSQLPQLEYVLLADVNEDFNEDVLSLPKLMAASSPEFTIPPTAPEDMALLHFTSGTTGKPKGAIHVHNAVYVHYMTSLYALDLHPDDIFWCTADPGWVTGTSYGISAPLCHGVTSIVDEADFDADRWFHILQDQKVTVWYTAPTAIRRLMRLDLKPREQYDLSRLRFIASVGEPLNPEAIAWSQKMLAMPIHDNWWQTETGGIMIANYPAMDIRPGSMGKPLPGIEAAIVEKLDGAHVRVVEEPNHEGHLALRPGWPSMFRGYLHDEERYANSFIDGWYISGDLAERDEDGYIWFIGRADDIIKTAGHMVGPFEVESALMEHPAVAEAGVIGVPDPVIGEVVKAFVALKPPFKPSEELRLELLGFGRKKLGSAVAPKQIEFATNLPKTRSGKIMRRLLKARELGLPEGDTSTLEEDKEARFHPVSGTTT
jgi:acetyl-CoA synthetase